MGKTRSNGPRNREQGFSERGPTLDSFDVREWFSRDPSLSLAGNPTRKNRGAT
jgi:hypothetical protein